MAEYSSGSLGGVRGRGFSSVPPRPTKGTVAPAGGAAPGGATYRSDLRMPRGLTLVRGTVIQAYQGIQYYEVATSIHQSLTCVFLGANYGQIGAMESSSFSVGQTVLVACDARSPRSALAFIIGGDDRIKDGDYHAPYGQLVYPQVSGFEYGTRMSGLAYATFPRLRNFGGNTRDVVDGDWIMQNRLGGALGVEAFRVFLQAGPAAGVYGYSEDNSLRLVGSKFERFTFGEEYVDQQAGPTVNFVGGRVLYPGDALTDLAPAGLKVGGGAYAGFHDFIGPRDGITGEDVKPRMALLHEYRGTDGAFMLTSAKSIILQKWVGVPMPVERAPPVADEEAENDDGEQLTLSEDSNKIEPACAPCELTDSIAGQPIDNGTVYAEIVKSQIYATISGKTGADARAMTFADELLLQALYGFRNLPAQWSADQASSESFGGTDPNATYFVDPHMWKSLPNPFAVQVGPGTNGVQKYNLGRSLFAILEDGSIVLQEPGGASITLSKGNIYLTAEKDIISFAGRNSTTISGRDAVVRADRHLDLNANTGRLTAVAANQATLVGGIDGQGGVLIESKGNSAATGTGEGEQPATTGGVIIKAKQMVGLAASQLILKADGNGWCSSKETNGSIILDAKNAVAWRGGNGYGALGASVSFGVEGSWGVVLGRSCVFNANLYTNGSLTYNQLAYSQAENTYADYMTSDIIKYTKNIFKIAAGGANPLQVSFTARWLSSAQYNTGIGGTFELPIPDWQLQVEKVAPTTSPLRKAVHRTNMLEGTAPYPGLTALATHGPNGDYLKGI